MRLLDQSAFAAMDGGAPTRMERKDAYSKIERANLLKFASEIVQKFSPRTTQSGYRTLYQNFYELNRSQLPAEYQRAVWLRKVAQAAEGNRPSVEAEVLIGFEALVSQRAFSSAANHGLLQDLLCASGGGHLLSVCVAVARAADRLEGKMDRPAVDFSGLNHIADQIFGIRTLSPLSKPELDSVSEVYVVASSISQMLPTLGQMSESHDLSKAVLKLAVILTCEQRNAEYALPDEDWLKAAQRYRKRLSGVEVEKASKTMKEIAFDPRTLAALQSVLASMSDRNTAALAKFALFSKAKALLDDGAVAEPDAKWRGRDFVGHINQLKSRLSVLSSQRWSGDAATALDALDPNVHFYREPLKLSDDLPVLSATNFHTFYGTPLLAAVTDGLLQCLHRSDEATRCIVALLCIPWSRRWSDGGKSWFSDAPSESVLRSLLRGYQHVTA